MTLNFLGNDKMPLYKELSLYTIQARYAPQQPPSEGGTVNMGKEEYGKEYFNSLKQEISLRTKQNQLLHIKIYFESTKRMAIK